MVILEQNINGKNVTAVNDVTDMNNISSFDKNSLEYEEWFDKHPNIYQSEILALKKAIPKNKKGIEIGSGTGRFSFPFKINLGVEPSPKMSKHAEQKGMTIINACAENLPFHNHSFDFALMVTTVCFLNDIPKAFSEVHRILKPKGKFIIGLIDRNRELGKKYEKEKRRNKFYRGAHFHSTEEIRTLLSGAGFSNFSFWQSLINSQTNKVEVPQRGYKKGSFIIIKSNKKRR